MAIPIQDPLVGPWALGAEYRLNVLLDEFAYESDTIKAMAAQRGHPVTKFSYCGENAGVEMMKRGNYDVVFGEVDVRNQYEYHYDQLRAMRRLNRGIPIFLMSSAEVDCPLMLTCSRKLKAAGFIRHRETRNAPQLHDHDNAVRQALNYAENLKYNRIHSSPSKQLVGLLRRLLGFGK